MRRISGLISGLLLGGPLAAQQIIPPGTAVFQWTAVNLLVVPDSFTGVGVALFPQTPRPVTGHSVAYVGHLTFDPPEALSWVASAESLAFGGGTRPLTLVARDSGLLVLAWNRVNTGKHFQSVLAYYPRPSSSDSALDIRLDSADAIAFLDSLRVKARISRLDPTAPLPDSSLLSPSDIVEKPEVLSAPPVRYPEELRLNAIQGTVLIQAIVDTTGRAEPSTIRVLYSPAAGFSTAARHLILKTVFRPAHVNGRATRAMIQVPVNFTLTHH